MNASAQNALHSPEVGLVLSGGGARGAYEAGVLSVLLPFLEGRSELPGIVLGTSIGSLNGAHVAATAQLSATESVERLLRLWREVKFSDIVAPLISLRELGRLLSYVAGTFGVPGASAPALFDTTPLPGLLERLVDWAQLHHNVEAGLMTLAVVATSYATGDSVVFHEGPCDSVVPPDPRRGIVYVPTRMQPMHVHASASIPVAFPAARVTAPGSVAGWYGDGGTRLNTPLKPALRLGAKRVIVIGLNSSVPPRTPELRQPDLFDGAAQYMQALFADPLAQDVATLSGGNRRGRAVPYMFIAPRDRLTVGRLAAETFRKHLSGPAALLRAPDLVTLGRIIGAGHDAPRGELFSLLFFATEFHDGLIALGRSDATRWLELKHDDGPWRLGPPPLPESARAAGAARGRAARTRRPRAVEEPITRSPSA
jgi:NTE family protein